MVDNAITLANERLPIVEALRMVDSSFPEFATGNMKLYCPFGHIYHMDGGASKAMKVFPDSNHAYCFAESAVFTPVTLIVQRDDVTPAEAAQWILDYTGYVPPDAASRMAALMKERSTPVVDSEALAEALKTYCARIDPGWTDRQFDQRISGILRKCLSLLRKVHTPEESIQWLTTTKQVMANALKGTRS